MKQIKIPLDLWKQLSKIARERKTSIRKEVLEALMQYIIITKQTIRDIEMLNKTNEIC